MTTVSPSARLYDALIPLARERRRLMGLIGPGRHSVRQMAQCWPELSEMTEGQPPRSETRRALADHLEEYLAAGPDLPKGMAEELSDLAQHLRTNGFGGDYIQKLEALCGATTETALLVTTMKQAFAFLDGLDMYERAIANGSTAGEWGFREAAAAYVERSASSFPGLHPGLAQLLRDANLSYGEVVDEARELVGDELGEWNTYVLRGVIYGGL